MLREQINSLSRFFSPVINIKKAIRIIPKIFLFFASYLTYNKQSKEKFGNLYPCLFDNTSASGIDPHYFYQGIWAYKKIMQRKPMQHVDIGSKVDFVGFLTTITRVCFVDVRPLKNVNLKNLEFIEGDILHLPFEDSSVESLSCLHVAEHIGLGRYGDDLDPSGTMKACKELARVLKLGGMLLFSLPIGKPMVHFNAHRIHTVEQILDYFQELSLVDMGGILDDGSFYEQIKPAAFGSSEYACVLFHFTKRHVVV